MTDKSELQLLCEKYEHWETDPWAPAAVLKKEILTHHVFDPCVGTGVLAFAAQGAGYTTGSMDIRQWEGYIPRYIGDYLNPDKITQVHDIIAEVNRNTIFMNPPFSLSEKFVDKSFEYGARKVVCFQKLSWYEGSYDKGKKRGAWWEWNRPARIWVCGDRAHCWRHDIPMEERGESNPTPYAFFVWEEGHAPAAITGQIYKGDSDAVV